jgi:hypothetical protein
MLLKVLQMSSSYIGSCLLTKQWPLAPNSREWQITRANVARRVTFFSKMAVENGRFGQLLALAKNGEFLASTRIR